MISDLLIGSMVGMLIMLIHLCSTVLVAKSVMILESWMRNSHWLFVVIAMMWMYILLGITLFICAGVWALVYYHLNLVDTLDEAFYSALVNYTTLGYGDLLQGTRTRLFGPIAAASGILMFSWAAAMLVYILQAHLPHLIARKKE